MDITNLTFEVSQLRVDPLNQQSVAYVDLYEVIDESLSRQVDRYRCVIPRVVKGAEDPYLNSFILTKLETLS